MSDLHDFFSTLIDRDQLAKGWKCHKRTIGNYEKLPDGLPYIEHAGKHLYDPKISDDWLRRRMVFPNKTRRG
jgi:hypothetical protein